MDLLTTRYADLLDKSGAAAPVAMVPPSMPVPLNEGGPQMTMPVQRVPTVPVNFWTKTASIKGPSGSEGAPATPAVPKPTGSFWKNNKYRLISAVLISVVLIVLYFAIKSVGAKKKDAQSVNQVEPVGDGNDDDISDESDSETESSIDGENTSFLPLDVQEFRKDRRRKGRDKGRAKSSRRVKFQDV